MIHVSKFTPFFWLHIFDAPIQCDVPSWSQAPIQLVSHALLPCRIPILFSIPIWGYPAVSSSMGTIPPSIGGFHMFNGTIIELNERL